MSAPTEVADAAPKLGVVEKPVSVIFLSDRIGGGDLVTTDASIRVAGHYQWPPDAPAEVRFSFDFQILTSDLCDVAVDWPGLLRGPIGPTKASYIMLLVMARPQFFITTPDGAHITVTYVGPFGQPEIVTGIQVAVASASADHSVSLLFRIELGNS
ncbi:MAG TPA: hypothetical protein VFQ39_18335 [Longimicrobium sp.]|nr:hypothetical protein [Longimicrobium sp.]